MFTVTVVTYIVTMISYPVLGEVHHLIMSTNGHTHVCEDGNLLIYVCNVTGSHIRWMDSLQLLFTFHDEVGEIRLEGKFTTVLLTNTYFSKNKRKLSSILFFNGTSSMLPTTIACSSNSDSKEINSSIAGIL